MAGARLRYRHRAGRVGGQNARGQRRAFDDIYLGLAQAYELFDEPGHGAEVYSLMRDSPLPPETYLVTYFDTGGERTDTLPREPVTS